MLDVKPEPPAEPADISDGWNFSVTNDPSQCQSLRLPSEVTMNEVGFCFSNLKLILQYVDK